YGICHTHFAWGEDVMATKTAGRKRTQQAPTARGSAGGGATASPQEDAAPSLAQVRLSARETADLQETIRILGLASRSDALREGLGRLHNEAVEIAGAEDIRSFYAGREAPPPEGAAWASPEELAAVDEMTW